MKTLAVLLGACAFFLPSSGRADVLPNDAEVAGRTIPEWSAEWWKWVFSVPASVNPMLDTDGRWATNNNHGPVFFLAGVIAISSTQTRSFAVSEDQYVMIPLINTWADNVATDPPFTLERLRELNDISMRSVTALHAFLDGVPAASNLFERRITSPVFTYEYLVEDNIHSWLLGFPYLGIVDPMLADGYYLMLEPLPPGRHTLAYGGAIGAFNFALNITNHITVTLNYPRRIGTLRAALDRATLPTALRTELGAILAQAEAAFGAGDIDGGIAALRRFQRRTRAGLMRTDREAARELTRLAGDLIGLTRSTTTKSRTP